MTRRVIAVCLTVAVLCASLAAPVSATESDNGTWVELLETAFVNGGKHNYFDYTTTKTIEIKTPTNMRICKIDMLMTYSVGAMPTKVEFYNLNGWASLTVKEIGPGLARIYGTVRSTFYSSVQIRFTRTATTTTYCELLSCKVSRINTQEFVADSTAYLLGATYNQGQPATSPLVDVQKTEQIRIDVNDWMKFDEITIWGSVENLPLLSIRATVGTKGLPITVSYLNAVTSGSESDIYYSDEGQYFGEEGSVDFYGDYGSSGEGETITVDQHLGKYLYCITIDLREIDRTITSSPLYVYMTGITSAHTQWYFTLQYVNGCIILPDTSEATWWTRFTTFMAGLFGSDKQDEADEQSATIESQVSGLQDAMDEMDAVTKPDIGEINVDAGEYVDPDAMTATGNILNEFMANEFVLTMMLIATTVGLGAFIVF